MKTSPQELIPLFAAVEVFRCLRKYWVEEAGFSGDNGGNAPLLPSPQMGEALGAINGLINDCQDAAKMLETIARVQPDEYAAFCRAVERL